MVDAVNFAREHDLLVSIRGGGHNVAGNAVNDGGIVIDLSEMRGVFVDPEAQTARVQGGATWADVDRETQLFGLATTGGQVSSTGVAGFTLHGGMGTLHRTFGLALDNLRSVEIVTADGQVRTASEAESTPISSGRVRGAGSNFGVVTSFEFALHPLGPEIYMAVPVFRLEDAVPCCASSASSARPRRTRSTRRPSSGACRRSTISRRSCTANPILVAQVALRGRSRRGGAAAETGVRLGHARARFQRTACRMPPPNRRSTPSSPTAGSTTGSRTCWASCPTTRSTPSSRRPPTAPRRTG